MSAHSVSLAILMAALLAPAAQAMRPRPLPHGDVGIPRFGAGCQFSTLQDALLVAHHGDTLYVRKNALLAEMVVIDRSVSIRAGTQECAPTQPADISRPVLHSTRAANIPTVYVDSNTSVVIEDLVIENGNGVTGNVYVKAGGSVELRNVLVRDGDGDWGGGVGGEGRIVLRDTTAVRSNRATFGGGVYVVGGELLLGDGVVIEGNVAAEWGGGVYARDSLVHQDGGAVITVQANGAGQYGGGMDLEGGVLDAPGLLFSGNTAGTDGGGLMVASESFASSVTNAGSFSGNHSGGNGGGLAVDGRMAPVTIGAIGAFTGNTAGGDGGGAYVTGRVPIGGAGSFDGNRADGDGGGAALEPGVSWGGATGPSTVTNNSAGGSGGGVHLSDASLDWSAYPATFTGNHGVDDGGAVSLRCFAASGALTLDAASFASNAADGGEGGAVSVDASDSSVCPVVIAGSDFDDNVAFSYGGGIAALGPVQLSLPEIKLHDNHAGLGGGGLALRPDPFSGAPVATIDSPLRADGSPGCVHVSPASLNPPLAAPDEYCVEITGNSTVGWGGGVYAEGGIASIASAGILGNTADRGGSAIQVGGAELSLVNAVIADHAGMQDVVAVDTGGVLDVRHATIAENAGTPLRFDPGAAGSLRGSAIAGAPISIDGSIGALPGSCNALAALPVGGGTLAGGFDVGLVASDFATDALRGRFQVPPGSPLLDDRCNAGPARDIDGRTRDSRPDRGAFEQ